VSSVAIDASGAAGVGARGGQGGEVSGTAAVTHGQTLDICVGVGGGAGGSSGGSAGGGASGVSLGSTFGSPLIVAGGGGGGGGGTVPGSGGAAGTPGTGNGAGSVGGGASTGSGGPGAGAAGSGTGGGGGGGYVGGGGGSGSNVGGGGGAGGTNFCSATCTTSISTSSPQVVISYVIPSAPVASIGTPASGAVYPLGTTVTESFSCAEGANGPGISSCTDQNGHPTGTPLDTSQGGSHTLTVTATSADGLSSSSSTDYTVVAPPKVWLPLPSDGSTYTLGQVVHSWFLCGEGDGGPGLKSCVDQNGQPSGAQVDTLTLGAHRYSITATSEDGQTASATVTYQVIPVPTVSHIQVHRGGLVTLQVTVFGPGSVDVMSTAGLRSFALAADVLRPPNGSFVFGSAHLVSARAQTLTVRVGPSQAGKLLLRDHRTTTVRLWVLYTTSRGTPQLVKAVLLKIRR
jgi:hypothetical protein